MTIWLLRERIGEGAPRRTSGGAVAELDTMASLEDSASETTDT